MRTRIIIVLAALITLSFVSCNKEESSEPSTTIGTKESLTAIIAQDLYTKTDYTIETIDLTKRGTFTWSEGDKFARFCRVNSKYGSLSEYTVGEIEGRSATFTGTASEGALSYALYPIGASNGADITVDNNQAYLYLNRPSTIVYNHSNPLKNLVPMIGKLEDKEFVFKPISGVIGFHASNIPETATSISLSVKTSGTKGLSGKSVALTSYPLDEVGMGEALRSNNGWARGWMASNDTGVSLTFAAGSFTEGDFFFPVPPTYTNGTTDASTQVYEGLKIEVKSANGDVLASASTSSNIQVDRAQIVLLPNISFPSTEVNVAITGTSTDIRAYISSSQGTFNKVCIAPLAGNTTADLNTAIPNNSSGTELTGITSIESAVSIAGFTTSGTNYVGVKAFSGESEVFSSILDPVYYLSSSDVTALCQQFTLKGTNLTTGTVTFAPSDDPKTSNIKLSEIDGIVPSNPSAVAITGEHRVFAATGSWIINNANPYNASYLQAGYEPTTIYENGTLSFDVHDKTKPLFYYGETSEQRVGVILHSEESSTNVASKLNFSYSDGNLTLTPDAELGTRLRVRVDGYTKPWGKTDGGAKDYGSILGSSPSDLPEISINNCTISTGDGMTGEGNINYLKDNNETTIWHSSYSNPRPYDATYGVYISIALPAAVSSIQVCYSTRHNNANGVPREIRYWTSSDGNTWEAVAGTQTIDVITKGTWVTLPKITSEDSFHYLRIGFVKAGNEAATTLSSITGFVSIAELALFGN